jgi:hypothetical protein
MAIFIIEGRVGVSFGSMRLDSAQSATIVDFQDTFHGNPLKRHLTDKIKYVILHVMNKGNNPLSGGICQ